MKRIVQAHRLHHVVETKEGTVSFGFLWAPKPEALKAGSLARAFSSSRHRRDMVLNMQELVQLLTARSVDMKDQSSQLAMLRLPTWLVSLLMVSVAPLLIAGILVRGLL